MKPDSLIPKASPSAVFFVLASISLVVLAMIFLEGILKPLVIAFFVWFIINQLKQSLRSIKIRNRSLPNWLANILSVSIILLLLVFVTELVVNYLEQIVQRMPQYISQFDDSIEKLRSYLKNPTISDYLEKNASSLNVSGFVSSVLGSLSGSVANFLVILVYVIFFLMEEAIYHKKLDKLFPVKNGHYDRFMKTLDNIFSSIRSYIWSKSIISFYTGAISLLILWIMNVEYAVLWSILIFLFNFIPYIGPLISSIIPAIFAGLASGDLLRIVYVFAAMEGVQFFLGNFLEPKIMGKGTNLGPVTVIVALAIFGLIWGLVGMILAVPIAALIVIICSQLPGAQWVAVMMSEEGEIGDGSEQAT